jgi:hypothetical protein
MEQRQTTIEMSDEWLQAFFEDSEKAQQNDDESEPEIKTQEQIYSYPDGTVYMGHMAMIPPKDRVVCDEEGGAAAAQCFAVSHTRHGSGTLRTPAFIYGIPLKNYTSDEAAENAHRAKWHEYIGTWKNNKLDGYGVHVQKSGDGSEIVIFAGIWENGKPKQSVYAKDEDGDYIFDDSVFGW